MTAHLSTPEASTPADTIKIEPSWKRQIGDEFSKPYMQTLRGYLKKEIAA